MNVGGDRLRPVLADSAFSTFRLYILSDPEERWGRPGAPGIFMFKRRRLTRTSERAAFE